jgi:hypothetical protein
VTLTQHAPIYRFPTSNFNFGHFNFLIFLSMQPLLSRFYYVRDDILVSSKILHPFVVVNILRKEFRLIRSVYVSGSSEPSLVDWL